MAEGGGCFDKEKEMVRPKKRLEGKVVEKTGRYVYNEKATVKRQVPLRQAGWNRRVRQMQGSGGACLQDRFLIRIGKMDERKRTRE